MHRSHLLHSLADRSQTCEAVAEFYSSGSRFRWVTSQFERLSSTLVQTPPSDCA